MAISGRRRIGIVAVVAALAVAAVGVASVRADPAPDLPPIRGDALLASTLAALARPFTISGEVETRFDLGIPQIPSSVSGGAGGGLMGAVSLVTGDQRYKVWRSADGVRVAHLLAFSEQDLIASRSDAWFWDSSDMSAVHLGVPGMTLGDAAPPATSVRDADVQRIAQRALEALAPYADVSVDTTAMVAGRPAYVLVLTPDVDAHADRSHRRVDRRRRRGCRSASRSSLAGAMPPRSRRGSRACRSTRSTRRCSRSPRPRERPCDRPRTSSRRRAHRPTVPRRRPSRIRRSFGSGFDLRVALRLDSALPEGADALLPYAGPLLSAITGRAGRTDVAARGTRERGDARGRRRLAPVTFAIRTTGLTKRYDDVAAVDGLDLQVERGALYGFLGPNGAGKTTTIRMALGLIHATSGAVEVLGEPVSTGRGPQQRVGALVEEPAFYRYLTGRRNLEYFARAGGRGEDTRRRLARIDGCLEQVGLTDAADKRVKAYSQGMRQRLGIGLALLGEPELLMLDEPTNGLDPTGMREMRQLLRGLADAGTTVFVSSHLLAEVEAMCDVVGVMAQGRIVAEGPPGTLRGTADRVRIEVDDVAAARVVAERTAGRLDRLRER